MKRTENGTEPSQSASLPRRLCAEAVGTALLLATVVGSGIMAEQLAAGNAAIALLANTLATGAALVALILTFGAISGAHFNPAVTIADALQGGIAWRDTPYYVLAQVVGALSGTVAAHLMFRLPVLALSQHVRNGPSQLFSEFVATFGLLSVIWGCSRLRSNVVAFAVGSYITAAYWFTASTSLCQSRRHSCSVIHRHVFRHSPLRCARIHGRSTCRGICLDIPVSLARAGFEKCRTGCDRPAP